MFQILFSKGNSKFYKDNVSFENNDFELLTKGVFLGLNFNQKEDISQYLINQYNLKGELFVNDLRGSFAICLYDKLANKKLIFTNQTGDQWIYYYAYGEHLIISDSIVSLVEWGKVNSIRFSLDNQGVYQLLSFGYMLSDSTLAKEIKRLEPGHYIVLENSKTVIKEYYKLCNKPNNKLSEDDAIEEIDTLFRKSIELEFEKDKSYGYNHLCSLSGGLDCRMTAYVSKEMGYNPTTNFTFSQAGYLDETIAKNIASELKNEWIFKSLDHGRFLINLENVIAITEGVATYSAHVHSKNAIDILNFENFGLLHTGQIGDVMISSFLSKSIESDPSFAKYNSDKLISKVSKQPLNNYSNQELFLLYNRGFNGALSGHKIIQQYTEVSSPFLDVDFMNFCLSIPIQFRKQHYIYKKWILKKYPNAAKYKWERTRANINAQSINVRGKNIPIQNIPEFIKTGILLKLGLRDLTSLDSAYNMNPFDYWYKTNENLPQFFNNYFNNNIHLVNDMEIKSDCKLLFNGTITEKMQVLSLLAAIKLIWE